MTIKDEGLKAYAKLLFENGFSIYEPGGHWDFFTYSRVVDGKECFGTVQKGYFGGYSHTMPIKPSQENGSSMFVGDDEWEDLTIEKAEQVASPTNSNPLVGKQTNYENRRYLDSYTKW